MIKGIQFRSHRVVGDIVPLAQRYRDEGADELVFYDITASPEGRTVERRWVERVAAVLDIPFCVAGGIRSVAEGEAVLRSGADKISVNSPALATPTLVDELARRFGSQCVVVGIDSRRVDGGFRVFCNTGDERRTQQTNRETIAWIREVIDRGAGEIVLNCMDCDGVRQGYDLPQLALAREHCNVPLVASGGAGIVEHFYEVFARTEVDGALAASVFHDGAIAIPVLKATLYRRSIAIRQ